jgi:tol-pal system protein YbgF
MGVHLAVNAYATALIGSFRRERVGLGLAFIFAVVITGCATTSEVETTRGDLSSLRIEQIGMKKDIAQIKEKVSEVSRDLNAVTGIRDSQSSLLTQSSDFSKELQALKGRFDENKYYTDKIIRELRADRDLQQAKIASLENALKELRSKAEPEKGPVPETPKEAAEPAQTKPVPPQSSSDPQRLYDEGQIAFKEKRYGDARLKLERLIGDHPKFALVPNAYFWIGESYYAQKKFEDAILAYETLLKTYPSHDKVRGGMLKQAYAFIELGDKKTGKVILDKIIDKYPQSSEAKQAEKKLSEIAPKSSGPAKKTKK